MDNKNITVPMSAEELEELLSGATECFDWVIDGINVHIIKIEQE